MTRRIWIAMLLLPTLAQAGGLEVLEQSPSGVGMAGARSAVSDDPSGIFYNPAAIAFQRGLGILGSLNIINADSKATLGSATAESDNTVVAPTLYVTQRLGSRFAIGVGGFANMGIVEDWPRGPSFAGRFVGTQLNFQTYTINPTLAIRPVPWLSLGFGLDVMMSAIELRKALNFGAGEGDVHASMGATGVGGNLGLLVQAQWFRFAFTYRSAIELDFDGHAALNVPIELAQAAASYQKATTSVTMPHNFTIGLAAQPLRWLTIDLDTHVTLWDSIQSLTLTLSDPAKPMSAPTVQGQELDFRNTFGVRLGLEIRALDDKLAVRVGGGYDRTPGPQKTVNPLAPDADRGVVSVGLGYFFGPVALEGSYMIAILPDRTSHLADYPARYDSLGHVIALGIQLRLDQVGGRINEPGFKY